MSLCHNPKTGAARSACTRVWHHSAHSCEEETLWLVPSLAALQMWGRWNVRPPAGPEEGAEDSRLEVPAGVPGGTGVVRSRAGSLL